jgi:hypothetical protein
MGDLQGEGSWSICIVVIYLSKEGATTAGDHDRVSGYSDKRSLSEHSLLYIWRAVTTHLQSFFNLQS